MRIVFEEYSLFYVVFLGLRMQKNCLILLVELYIHQALEFVIIQSLSGEALKL